MSTGYSLQWFETFALSAPPATTEAEADAIALLAPSSGFPRLLDVGCGAGRMTRAFIARGYDVTGIDVSVQALQAASVVASGATYVALDQRHAGSLRWTFDAAFVLWNSIGFGSVQDDRDVLRGLWQILRPGGVLLLDLYHPGWLTLHQQAGYVDARGATIDSWVRGGRCFNVIRYADGTSDQIQFNGYEPDEMQQLAAAAGFACDRELVWWKDDVAPGSAHARYQLRCIRE